MRRLVLVPFLIAFPALAFAAAGDFICEICDS